MRSHARWLAALVAGLGLANAASADPNRSDSVLPNGARKTVIEVLPATELDAPPDTLPPTADPPGKPSARVIDVPPPEPVLGHSLHLWAEAEWLEWWYRGASIPPLVTAGSPLDPTPGALGGSGTRVLFGGQPTHQESTPGGRLRLGGWAPDSPVGWEVGGFYTQPQETSGLFPSGGVGVLARPFYDSFLATPGSLLFGAPGAFTGSINTHTRTSLWGLEANATAALDTTGTLVGFVGYRYLQMTDDLAVSGQYTLGAGGLAFTNGIGLLPGATGLIADRFRTKNEFNGAQVGAKYHACWGRFAFDVRGALAVGMGSERVNLEGVTNTVDAGGTVRQAPFGVLVQRSNAGQYGRDLMTVVPDVEAKVHVAIAPGVSIHVGYDFLYWASVARAADQIDAVVDTRQMPSSGNFNGGPGFRPVSPLRDTAFWAHGFNVGLRVDY